MSGAVTGAGGEVLIRHTNTVANKAITLGAAIVASGGASVESGDTGGVGGVVTILNDSGSLAETSRRDTLVCSPGCRVKAHRSGGAVEVRRMAASARVAPGLIVRCQAIKMMRPDLGERLRLWRVRD